MPPRREPVNNPLAARLNGSLAAALDEMMTDIPPQQVVEVPGLVVTDDGTIPAKGFQITRTGLMRYDNATRDDWMNVGAALLMMKNALQWLVGDWLLFGHTVYGVTYEEAAEQLGREIGTLYNWVSVCSAIDFSRRREKLSFSIHLEVAKLPPEQQDYWLARAEAEGWSQRTLRAEMNGGVLPAREPAVNDDLRWLMKHGGRARGERKRSEIRARIGRLRLWLDALEREGSE